MKVAKQKRKTTDRTKHQLEELVRYLARRAAERDYATLKSEQSRDESPRRNRGKDQ